ncbi:cation:proton antiporter [Levilactobacillus tujiorum]|uniref:cation:proton antiporter n=1 Tax=Levilactobacillus tujiorum TaxID=2912243 RepID=UPI001457813D|nr:sodium:proton antiporter [Levilactobacillus tujiorum]NLR30989.1 sodium:proton antiporter [Levilactobacillus tujiorum]
MAFFVSTFILLVTVAMANLLAQWVPISKNYLALGAGIVVALMPSLNQLVLPFENDIFMMLILAPLLFFEGQVTPMVKVGKGIPSILGTAFILAIVSAIVVTVGVHQGFAVGLPLALVMVAISTPTDATAFESVITGRKISQRLGDQLKMESLFNDATGLILLQAGLIWVKTSEFSFGQNLVKLLVSALGGAFVGGILAVAFMLFRQALVRTEGNVISSQTLVYLLTPIIIYLVAERLDVSGIIAVVVAGLIHNGEANSSRFTAPRQMYLGTQLMNFSSEILNGGVFVILGISLERIVQSQHQQMFQSLDWLWLGLMIYGGLLICRLVYAYGFAMKRQWLNSWVFALGGVHGTVTLAMTFSIAGMVSTFWFRQVILVETVVIVLSMLVPTILFRWLLPQDGDALVKDEILARIRQEMTAVGIQRVQELDLPAAVKRLVVYDLQDQTKTNPLRSYLRRWRGIISHREAINFLQSRDQRWAMMQAFASERAFLTEQARQHVVDVALLHDVYTEVLMSEALVVDPYSRMV